MIERERLKRAEGDEHAAYLALLDAVRRKDRAAALTAFRAYFGMPTPGTEPNPHINTLRKQLAEYCWVLAPGLRDALDCLEFEWEQVEFLGRGLITKAVLVAESEWERGVNEHPHVEEAFTSRGDFESGLGVTIVALDTSEGSKSWCVVGNYNGGPESYPVGVRKGAVKVFRVVPPPPQPGTRYKLVPADEWERLTTPPRGAESDEARRVRRSSRVMLVHRSREWVMPEPARRVDVYSEMGLTINASDILNNPSLTREQKQRAFQERVLSQIEAEAERDD